MLECYILADKEGHIQAPYEIYLAYKHGIHVKADIKVALMYLRIAIEMLEGGESFNKIINRISYVT